MNYNNSNDTETLLSSASLTPFTLPQKFLLPGAKYGIGRNRTTNFIMLDSVHVSRDQVEIETDLNPESNSLRIVIKSRAKSTINGNVHLLSSAEARSNSFKTLDYVEKEITILVNRFTIELKWVASLKIECLDDLQKTLKGTIPVLFTSVENADICITNSSLKTLMCLASGVGILEDPPTEWLQQVRNTDDLFWYYLYEKYLKYPLRDRKLFLSTIKCITENHEISLLLVALGGTVVSNASLLQQGDSFFIVGDETELVSGFSATNLDKVCDAIGSCELALLDIHKIKVKKETQKRPAEDAEVDNSSPMSLSNRRKRRKYARIDQLEFLDFSQVPDGMPDNTEVAGSDAMNEVKELVSGTKNTLGLQTVSITEDTIQLETESPESIRDNNIGKRKSTNEVRALNSEQNQSPEIPSEIVQKKELLPARLTKRKLSFSDSAENSVKRIHSMSLADAVKQTKLQSVHHIKLELGLDDKFMEKESTPDALAIVQTVNVQLRRKPKEAISEVPATTRKNFKKFVKNRVQTPEITRKYVEMDPVTVTHSYNLVNPNNVASKIDYEQTLQHDFEGLIANVNDVNISNNHIEEETLFVPESSTIEKHQVNHDIQTKSIIHKPAQQYNNDDGDDDDDDDSQPRFAFRQT